MNLEEYDTIVLSTKEMSSTNGGENIFEYIAMGLGYAWAVYSQNIGYGSAGYAPGYYTPGDSCP